MSSQAARLPDFPLGETAATQMEPSSQPQYSPISGAPSQLQAVQQRSQESVELVPTPTQHETQQTILVDAEEVEDQRLAYKREAEAL